jgi:quercetin dioxygenase-like cupin family protein
MNTHNRSRTFSAAVLALVLLAAAGAAAQNTGIKRTPILKADVSVPGREAVVARVELDPGGHPGRHTHPGDEIGYALDGEGELLIDGEAPRKLKAGDAFVVPAGKVHDLRNHGSAALHTLNVYVVDKGKPLATPAK